MGGGELFSTCCDSKFPVLALNPSMICVYPLILFLDIPITTTIPQHYEPLASLSHPPL